ncbi:MAG: hypothetical protein CL663_02265 [Bacteroidetes bacterium]|nr:hypothetical protein [Bacteroidota bacterium]
MNYEKLNILKNREGKRLKRLRKRKRWKKGQNVLKYTRTQPKSIRVNRNPYTSKVENISIVAEASFTLFDQPESCIKLIRRLDKVKKINTRGYIIVEIDLSGVVWIDQGAISFLLAKINELKQFRGKRIKIWGNSPKHKGAQHIFNESGFLDYMKDMFGKKFRGSIKSHIFKVGSDKMLNRNVG